jgi:hypothetical protein
MKMIAIKQGETTTSVIECQFCNRGILTSWVCIWQEDVEGKPYDVTFLHYGCLKRFVAGHKGKWLSRGMPARSIQW